MSRDNLVIRPVSMQDLDNLQVIAGLVGPGFTSLPNDKNFLKKKIEHSIASFAETIDVPERSYLFIMDDIKNNKCAGICGIVANVGCKDPFYNFHVATITQVCYDLNKHLDHKILQLANDFQNASELVTLFLHPDYRGDGIGALLSRSRFLFMAEFKEKFAATIIAEMRGVISDKGESVFWDAVCKPFFAMDYTQADALTTLKGKQFIEDLIPKYPIYLELLPKGVQDVIGVSHHSTKKATSLLEHEGFEYKNYVDIFDGSPLIEAKRDAILTVKNSHKLKVKVVNTINVEASNAKEAMLCNAKMDFRFCIGTVTYDDALITIDIHTANKLMVKDQDFVRYCLL